METSSSTRLSPSELDESLALVEVKPGLKFSKAALKQLLPDVETVLFFGKVYGLDVYQLSEVLSVAIQTPLAQALLNQGAAHSNVLQDYVLDIGRQQTQVNMGDIAFDATPVQGEILPELWKALEVEVADSIKAVAAKLDSVISALPGKQGSMVFKSLSLMNKKRPTIGDFRAQIHHAPVKENLVVLDVSGSMTENTIRTIVNDVVALSWQANAHLAIVSNDCFYWQPGSYSVQAVLDNAQYAGTHYEELTSLFDRDWGTVVAVADYDSSRAAKQALSFCTGNIDELLDVSLVNRPTFLGECIGQLAASVRPLLVASDHTYGVLS